MDARDGDTGGDVAGTGQRPFGVVVASAVEGLRRLARSHVELAKIEAAEAAGIRGQGVAMFTGAAVVAMYAIGFMAAAGAAGLAVVLPVWAAILIVALVLLVVAWLLTVVARRTLRSAPAPGERTKETLKEDARWAKRQIAR